MPLEKNIYLDNHATTPVDPRVRDAMWPFFCEHFGNPGSRHRFGEQAQAAVDQARASIARQIGASAREIVFTSGATESNNLAIRGVCERPRRRGNHLISVVSEHKAILDPLAKQARRGLEVTYLPVQPAGSRQAGRIDPDELAAAIREDTVLVTVMLANNEIGVLQPLAEIGRLCRDRGVLLHSDATQAVGRLPVDVGELNVDMMSFSAHKFYGPKGIGALYVARRTPRVRLESQVDGGRQQSGLRSGTLNVPGIVGMARALELAVQEMKAESQRLAALRDRLFHELVQRIPEVERNGPALDDPRLRLAGNLNCSFGDVEGEALMMCMPEVAVSSGSACSSFDVSPSHVLTALGLEADRARASLRFGLGRFNTAEDVTYVIQALTDAVHRLRTLGTPPV